MASPGTLPLTISLLQMSGYEIYNNTFVDCQKGTFIGGGRRNHVHNNYYESCDTAVHLDNRGLNWQHASCLPVSLDTMLWMHLLL